ncbi:class I SAM-dependent methyltransferase [Verticiella sediminum]|uniref:Class I SAM-dependent methyltransferase n=1 Tax=Verticiella sediminum TaxID=1247510 RepID=A0A556AW27_9BURK|nr:class I SAM-dependent methyltransferase [Verticiella sediminum]TSH97163.1 class I SAM-dependent methyltransferase [Verticiella sediminum]
MPPIHESAAVGFSAEADTYARGRPDYPDALIDWLRQPLGVMPGAAVVDLGAGTGKFTRLLTRTGASVCAVEPVAAMREALARELPEVPALPGTAEAIPLPDASVQAVVCAQAFHWFASVEALAEIHRVLAPQGRLGLVWNVRDESVDWVAAISRIMAPFETETPRHHRGEWREPFARSALFTLPEPSSFAYAHVGPPRVVVMDRMLSVSFIAALPDAEKAAVKAQLEALIQDHPALRGKDTVAFPYRTDAYACTRR